MKNKYKKIDLFKINQMNKVFYIGKIKFSDFENCYTTSPAEYKKIVYSSYVIEDDRYLDLLEVIEDYYNHRKEEGISGFQRIVDDDRVDEIANYIMNNEYGIIPNSVIVSVDAIEIEDKTDFDALLQQNEDEKAILFEDNLYILENKKVFLVIDGQHRIEGCRRIPPDKRENMDLIMTFIINVDIKTQAQLFTTINYKVKPVNKSYLYQILGEFNIGDNEIVFLHELIKLLNELDNSPLQDRIKMLGRQDSYKNSLSQAFLAESLYLLILPKYKLIKNIPGSNELLRLPIFRVHFLDKNYRTQIAKFIIIYLKTIKEIYNSTSKVWDDKNSNIFLKTIGMGGLIDLIPNLYVQLLIQKNKIGDQFSIDFTSLHSDLYEILKPLGNIEVLNTIEAEYSKTSGRGMIKKLALKLLSVINAEYIEIIEYRSYIDWFNGNAIFIDNKTSK